MEKFVIARKVIHVNGAKTSNLFHFFQKCEVVGIFFNHNGVELPQFLHTHIGVR